MAVNPNCAFTFNSLKWFVSCLALLLISCGGGLSDNVSTHGVPQVAAQRAAASPQPNDIEALFHWAESAYPSYFPGPQPTQQSGIDTYRYYPATGNYIDLAGDNIYLSGPIVDGAQAVPVGKIGDFACRVYPGSCDGPAGSAGSWSSAETVDIPNDRYQIAIDNAGDALLFGGHSESDPITHIGWETNVVLERKVGQSWSAPFTLGGQLIKGYGSDWGDRQLGVDAAGNAYVAVTRAEVRPERISGYDDTRTFLSYRRANESSWSAPLQVASDPTRDASRPSMVVEPGGRVWLAWLERVYVAPSLIPQDFKYDLVAATFSPSAGLGPAETVAHDLTYWAKLLVRTDGHGNPTILVTTRNSDQSLRVATRGVDGKWSGLSEVARYSTAWSGPLFSDILVDAAGRAILTWDAYRDGRSTIFVKHFDPANGWGPEMTIGFPSVQHMLHPQIVMDPRGNATLAWQEYDGAGYGIFAARFEPLLGWTRLDHLNSSLSFIYEATVPLLAVDGAGNVMAAWRQQQGWGASAVGWSRFTATTGWSAPQLFGGQIVSDISMAGSIGGTVLLHWNEENPGPVYTHRSARFNPAQ
jgi:hypothetical protein